METHPEPKPSHPAEASKPKKKSFADMARQPPASSAIRKGNNAATSSTDSMQKGWFGGQAIFVTKKGKKVSHTKEKLKELSEASSSSSSKQTQGLGRLNETGKRIPQPAKKIKEISGASSTNSPTRTQVSRDLKEENVPMDEIKGIVDVEELKSLHNDLARYLEQELTSAFSTEEVSSESDKCDPRRPQQIDQNLELLPDKLSEVKRLCKADYDMNAKKIQILIKESKYYPNLVRYYGVAPYKEYFYVAMEKECYLDETSFNLDELIQLDLANSNPSEVVANDRLKVVKNIVGKFELIPKNGSPIPDLLSTVMRKVLCGLVYLHDALGISHGDLKPQNIRIIKEGSLWRVKLSGMGIKTGSGTLDMHAFGRIFSNYITGIYEFGDWEGDTKKRDSLLKNYPEARHLFLCLTSETLSLTAKEALHHPYFWNPGAKLSFLLGTYERVSTSEGKDIRNELETISSKVIEGKWKGEHVKEWNNRIDADIMKYATDQLKMYSRNKTYKYKSLPNLLKLIRHTCSHYGECPPNIQKSIGSLGEGFYNYFGSRFPNLLIEVYIVVVKWCGKENVAPSCWLHVASARRAAARWIAVQRYSMGSMALQKSAPGCSRHNGSAKRAQHKGN
ncbi:Serine/threonine-protein kinase/endoribonuclease IRE2 [Morus notabilis]|uniref:Serine/threonine-protein kinase/endoribonuclease IRE2 n=1 Tax=Morus notabilis TaxID=981085 RepID=W9SA41_9ROSA|nr:Serine/threonine-protein kinase/endoribonuclease IRE2 [Morus notabilis]